MRGIRHTIALEAWIARTRRAAHAAEARADATQTDRTRIYLRHRVDHAIITTAGGRTYPMRIRLEEHLANPGLDAQFASRPFEHIVADICRDLGVPPPPSVQLEPASLQPSVRRSTASAPPAPAPPSTAPAARTARHPSTARELEAHGTGPP